MYPLLVFSDFANTCRQDVKELKVRPGTDVHDYEVRLRAAQKFLAKVIDNLLAFALLSP